MRAVASTFAAAICFAATVNGSFIPFKRATPQLCNGHAEFCNRSYGNITHVGAHNSYAFSQNPSILSRDQEVDIPTQLQLGVRLLQAQSHLNNGVLHFCHTVCSLFDGGAVVDYLTIVKTFLDANPNEVITLLFTNPDGLNLPNVWAPVFVASGMVPYMYIPSSRPVDQSDWPTLGELINSGKRVVMFMDYGGEGQYGGVIDYILPEFEMIWETPFSQTNASFPCSIDRTEGPLPNDVHMYLINHSLNVDILPIGGGVIVSDPSQASVTNGIPSILANAYGCAPLASGRAPNFVLLDFVNIGDGFRAANILNGLPQPQPSSTSSTSMSASKPSATSQGSRLAVQWLLLISGFVFTILELGFR